MHATIIITEHRTILFGRTFSSARRVDLRSPVLVSGALSPPGWRGRTRLETEARTEHSMPSTLRMLSNLRTATNREIHHVSQNALHRIATAHPPPPQTTPLLISAPHHPPPSTPSSSNIRFCFGRGRFLRLRLLDLGSSALPFAPQLTIRPNPRPNPVILQVRGRSA